MVDTSVSPAVLGTCWETLLTLVAFATFLVADLSFLALVVLLDGTTGAWWPWPLLDADRKLTIVAIKGKKYCLYE